MKIINVRDNSKEILGKKNTNFLKCYQIKKEGSIENHTNSIRPVKQTV